MAVHGHSRCNHVVIRCQVKAANILFNFILPGQSYVISQLRDLTQAIQLLLVKGKTDLSLVSDSSSTAKGESR